MLKRNQRLDHQVKQWTKHRNHNNLMMTGTLMGMATLATFGASAFTTAHATQYKGKVISSDKAVPKDSDFPKYAKIAEKVDISEMAPYGAAAHTLLGSKMEVSANGYQFLAFCENYAQYGPSHVKPETYSESQKSKQLLTKIRRVYLANQDTIDKMVGGNDDDAYMVQQIAVWEGVGNFSTYNPNSNGDWAYLTKHRISDARRAAVKKAVDWLFANAGKSKETTGVPNSFVTVGKTETSGSNIVKHYTFGLSNNYGFNKLHVEFHPDKLGDLQGKVKVQIYDTKTKSYKDVANDFDAGEGTNVPDIGDIKVTIDKDAWDKAKVDVADFLDFTAEVNNYVASHDYRPSIAGHQPMMVTTKGDLKTKVEVPLKKTPGKRVTGGSGKSTAMDTDTGTQTLPNTNYDKVNLKDTYRLDGGGDGPYTVINQLIDPRTNNYDGHN